MVAEGLEICRLPTFATIVADDVNS